MSETGSSTDSHAFLFIAHRQDTKAETGESNRHNELFIMRHSLISSLLLPLLAISCGSNLNSIGDTHFDDEGYLIRDSLQQPPMVLTQPSHIKFYVEVSGSMNGFFRANKATEFKTDVWEILNYYSSISEDVRVLTNDGSMGASLTLSAFQAKMNTGQFVSSASTKVPLMLQSIINDLDAESGEVAVLISDMKYSPVGQAAPDVLLAQYSTDISTIFGKSNLAVSLIGATSDYLDKTGKSSCDRSPYYFLVLGSAAQVGEMRNGISTLLDNRHHFVDNIETGFNYGVVRYDFGKSNKCEQLDNAPTFYAYEEPEDDDTCTIQLRLHLENYRWLIADEDVLRACFQAQPSYGSQISIGNVKIEVQNIIDKQLHREAVAIIDLKITDMPLECEVIEWSLTLPDSSLGYFSEFTEDATNEDDVSKSYSVGDFIRGMFYGGIVNQPLPPNYILVSKNN